MAEQCVFIIRKCAPRTSGNVTANEDHQKDELPANSNFTDLHDDSLDDHSDDDMFEESSSEESVSGASDDEVEYPENSG